MFGPLALLLGVGALVLAFGAGGGGAALKKEYARLQQLDGTDVVKVQKLLQQGTLQDMPKFQEAIQSLRHHGFPAIAAQLEARARELRKQQFGVAA